MKIQKFAGLLRVEQWYKNLLVFVGPIFALRLFDLGLYPILLSSFVSLCLISSANYIINDILDAERDRWHPEKRLRPIASGEISVRAALAACIALFAASALMAYGINFHFLASIIALFLSSQMYSLLLKKVAVIDVLTISINYVLRAVAGCLSIGILISPWLILGIFFVALLLALGKRKSELSMLGGDAHRHKEVFRAYTEKALDEAITLTSGLVIMTYAMYSMYSPVGDSRLVLTLPLVVFLMIRYNLLLHEGDPAARKPHELLRDRAILAAFASWIFLLVALLYFLPSDIHFIK